MTSSIEHVGRMRDDYETVSLDRPADHVLVVTLDRPQASNAMNTQMGLDLMHVFESFLLDLQQVRCIVLTGRGDKAFSAGGDLKERKGMTDETWQAQHVIFERLIRAVVGCPIPVIAAVNGAAYGGGCEVAAACDFVFAARQARFALTEVTLGIMPGAGGTQNLSRAVGERRAKEMILTGQPFSAQEAYDWGLVNRIFEQSDLMSGVLGTAEKIALNAPIAVQRAKQSISRGMQMSIWDGLAFEIEAYNRMVPTEDRREGVLAFNEKRRPNFKGR
jgi:enoyl-CoA hydratase/carnithine racemase